MYDPDRIRPEAAVQDGGLTAQQAFPETLSLAMAYVPTQRFVCLYEPETGFERGTIFKQLDLPFLGKAVDA